MGRLPIIRTWSPETRPISVSDHENDRAGITIRWGVRARGNLANSVAAHAAQAGLKAHS